MDEVRLFLRILISENNDHEIIIYSPNEVAAAALPRFVFFRAADELSCLGGCSKCVKRERWKMDRNYSTVCSLPLSDGQAMTPKIKIKKKNEKKMFALSTSTQSLDLHQQRFFLVHMKHSHYEDESIKYKVSKLSSCAQWPHIFCESARIACRCCFDFEKLTQSSLYTASRPLCSMWQVELRVSLWVTQRHRPRWTREESTERGDEWNNGGRRWMSRWW